MYFFGLSKEEVLSQKHVVSYEETSKQSPISMVTLFGRQVYQVKSESSKSDDGYTRRKDIDLRLPADHYAYDNFHETFDSGKVYGIGGSRNTVELGIHSGLDGNKGNEALARNRSGKRNPKIVIDLEGPPEIELEASVSYVTEKVVDQSLVEDGNEKTTDKEDGLLDLNSTPLDESISEPHYCFLQDLNSPYIEETETSCGKSGVDDGTTPLSSPKSQNVHDKDGTASPASDTSCCTTENNLRTDSRTRALDPSCRTRLEFSATEGVLDDEEELSEMIQMAAQSLVRISADLQSKPLSTTDSSSQDQDKPEMGKSEPACSCDSYELHTLGISETNTEEDCCVSSMNIDQLNNITKNNNKEFGLKLRRGRRMKHFQKEILPCLTSLSRHEIREDINILEAVLRSREYKKMQGKTKDVKFKPNPKNKRSTPQRYVGKRSRRNE